MGTSARSFNFVDLDDEVFEELTFLLGHLEVPGLVRTADPDGGLDAVVPGVGGLPASRGFQAKRFTRTVSWAKCRDSLDAAVANYDVKHVTFTFPINLTGPRLQKFREELQSRHAGVGVDYWGASQLTARLLASDAARRIARHIFGQDDYERMSRLVRAQQDLDTTGQVLSGLGAMTDRFSDDPYFHYSVGARPASVPAAQLPAGTVLRVEVADEHGVRHIDALATPAAIAAGRLPQGSIHVEGEDDVQRLREFLRKGGELELSDVRVTLGQAPKHMESLVEPDVRGELRIVGPLRPPALRQLRIEVDTASGRCSIDVDMQPIEPPAGWQYALVGHSGGAELGIRLRIDGERGELSMDWRWRLGASTSASELLAGLRFAEAAASEGELRIVERASANTIVTGASPHLPFDDELQLLKPFFEDLVRIERWLGTEIEVPDTITDSDGLELRKAVQLIDKIETTWTDVSFTLATDSGEEAVARNGVLQLREPYAIELFGRSYELGDRATYVTHYALAESRRNGAGRTFVLQPANAESRLVTRLEPSAREIGTGHDQRRRLPQPPSSLTPPPTTPEDSGSRMSH